MDSDRSEYLQNKGVYIPNPQTVEIGDDVNPDRIAGKGIIIYPGCRISGKTTLIMSGAKLGGEGPVTIQDCQLGPGVQLKGGYFKSSVFLKDSSAGSGAHVREGTIFEEEASIAHTVGLKQTILFPFVTLGSLINFCDCFMAGGTSRKNHSEVGSSYIHFNFTPNQDKATASLIGDVPRGVMLDQSPIFLGGQGGLVGPCRLAYGTIVAAGSIYRKDELRPGRLLMECSGRGGSVPFVSGVYRSVKRIFINNIIYIGNLFALRQWYLQVRSRFISKDFSQSLFDALIEKLDMAIEERMSRLEAFCEKMPASIEIYRTSINDDPESSLLKQKKELHRLWPEIKNILLEHPKDSVAAMVRDEFLEALHKTIKDHGKNYIQVIKNIDPAGRLAGSTWLQSIVDHANTDVIALLPTFK